MSNINDKVLNMRMNEFGFSRISYLCDTDRDDFPYRFHIVKYVDTEQGKFFQHNKNEYEERTYYCYAIGELEWDDKEPCWEFRSIGTRFLEDGTDDLMKWILKFCEKYIVEDGELIDRCEKCISGGYDGYINSDGVRVSNCSWCNGNSYKND